MTEGVYLDHAATSPLRPEAAAALQQNLSLRGNPSALHLGGQRAKRVLEAAREEIAAALGADPNEVIFTSGGSEANSIAILGAKAGQPARPEILTSEIEHPSVAEASRHGARQLRVTSQGVLDLNAIDNQLTENVGLVSVALVNNETGIEQPVAQLRETTAKHGILLHSDAVQALGHLPLSFKGLDLDLMSVSAHKIGGPVGIGALLARRETPLTPIGLGGGQERNLRSGTQPAALAAAFAAAATAAVTELAQEQQRLAALQRRLAEITQAQSGRCNTMEGPSYSPHILNVTFERIRAADLIFLLDQQGVYASVGSACRAGVHQPSEVLLAMGRTQDEAAATLRFSLGWDSVPADVERLAQILPEALTRARAAF